MKKRDLVQLSQKSASEIINMVIDQKKEKTNTILEIKLGRIKNIHVGRERSKDIARALTILKTKAPNIAKEVKNAANKNR